MLYRNIDVFFLKCIKTKLEDSYDYLKNCFCLANNKWTSLDWERLLYGLEIFFFHLTKKNVQTKNDKKM